MGDYQGLLYMFNASVLYTYFPCMFIVHDTTLFEVPPIPSIQEFLTSTILNSKGFNTLQWFKGYTAGIHMYIAGVLHGGGYLNIHVPFYQRKWPGL